MLTGKRIAVVGSREFRNYAQLEQILTEYITYGDELVSGGALGADSMAQRYAKEHGLAIHIYYPLWYPNGVFDKGAGYKRNGLIVKNSDMVIAFYQKGRFQQGGTANTASWARDLNIPLMEYEET